ncbi:family 20 glycosylhydrolase [uncultured Chitinophaga sp.]|uniref:glycoside hydrolase family 20 protein n=1 Tax=uncultured Chitinophaga sp. TaxID=339340 RepID=UPI0026219BE1|nr:family 20 glycosylhydrolase [uncultured Chitinophaga sp.]
MYIIKRFVTALLLGTVCCNISYGQSTQKNGINIIPKPSQVTAGEGYFLLKPGTAIFASPVFQSAGRLFIQQAGLTQKLQTLKSSTTPAGSISIVKAARNAFPSPAAYRLEITSGKVTITAGSDTGALNGVYSLLQLLLLQPEKGMLPCALINDQPRFSYRGIHLDVSRHFRDTAQIKRFLDLMALYKMNTFHWHLTDGAGWRLEIKKYPELTRQAAWRTHGNWKDWRDHGRQYSKEGDPNTYGGYYTQDEARAMVAYAQERGITVIPEIEMPGHSEEVLAVYPQLGCTGLPYKNSEFCLGNDSTFTFLEDVLTEVMNIFPSTYIHIGGDEADKKAWKQCPKCQQRIKDEHLADEHALQSYAVRRMEKFLQQHHRRLLGWDEILEGGLAPDATVMSWRGEAGGITAAKEGHDVVMTPGRFCYFDAYQGDPVTQPEAIGGYLPLEKVYSYDPVPQELDSSAAQHILGAQATIWTEYIPTFSHLEYMTYPRLLGLSEVTWTAAKDKSWTDFQQRLQAHYLLLQRLHVNYYRPSYDLTIKPVFNYSQRTATITFSSEQYQPQIRYTLDGTQPNAGSPLFKDSILLDHSAVVTAAIFRDTIQPGKAASLAVDFHKAIGKKVQYNKPYNKSYVAQKEHTLVNGYRGSLTYGDGQWQGFTNDLDVTLDMEQHTSLQSLSISFMQLTGPGVYMPGWVEVSVSDDGQNFRSIQKIENDVPVSQARLTFKEFKFDLKQVEARYVRVQAANTQHGFLFTDEIIVY